ALIARPGFIDPDVDAKAAIMRQVDWCRSGAPIHGCKPAGVAVGENVDRLARLLGRRDRLDQSKPVSADLAVDADILLGDLAGAFVGGPAACGRGPPPDPGPAPRRAPISG